MVKCGYSYIEGKSWTTDAIYRVTAGIVNQRKEQGQLAPRDLKEYGLSKAERLMALAFECGIAL